MFLEMYLDGELVDITTPVPFLLQTKSKEYLKGLIASFEQKHAALLKTSPVKPSYLLSGVQSRINGFTPLRHPAAAVLPGHTTETKAQPTATSLQPVEKKTEPVSVSPVETGRSIQIKKVA